MRITIKPVTIVENPKNEVTSNKVFQARKIKDGDRYLFHEDGIFSEKIFGKFGHCYCGKLTKPGFCKDCGCRVISKRNMPNFYIKFGFDLPNRVIDYGDYDKTLISNLLECNGFLYEGEYIEFDLRNDLSIYDEKKVLFGKEDETTHQRSKTNDWINIFYSEVRKSGKTEGSKGGASLLDVCEMFATLNAYYQLGKATNSAKQSGEMLNSQILTANFSSLLAGKQQAIQQTITQSKNLQNQLAQDPKFLKNIITQLSKEGNKAGVNVKDLYTVASSKIASIISKRIKIANIWKNKEHKEEMFKKVFALLTSDPFSSFSDENYRKRFNNGE